MMQLVKLLQDKRILLGLLGLVLLVLVGAGLYFKMGKQASEPLPKTDAAKLVKTEVQKEQLIVEITPKGFIPQTVQLKAGGVIKFVNTDVKPHQVMSDPHPTHTLSPFLNTDEVLNKGESVVVVIEKTGTFTYHDYLNPLSFTGVIKAE